MNGKWAYYQRLASLYRSYRRRERVVPSPPLRLWVEISSRCNLRCAFCPNKDLPAGQKGDMDWVIFKNIIDQGRAFAFEINLHHRGETLLHPEAGRFIRYAAGTGLSCRLHTNATLLKGKVSEEILSSSLQRLSVSFDGFSAETYEKNRCGASFEQVTGNIAGFLEQRRRRQQNNPRLTIEMMELPAAADNSKRREFIERFKKLGLDELVIKKSHNWAGYLDSSPGGEPSGDSPARGGKFSACTFPWNALLVLFNGEVLPCAQDFFGSMPLGNVREKTLLEIWNDPPMQVLRQAFAAGETADLPTCSACDRIRRPTLGGVPKEYLKRIVRMRMP